ncbi:MAG: putative metal-binding motif-containing protein [Deltaproteobacteria bacterium]|nr:putative metal-binding motif-containing protein [Deltaproteobacteria bacterium]
MLPRPTFSSASARRARAVARSIGVVLFLVAAACDEQGKRPWFPPDGGSAGNDGGQAFLSPCDDDRQCASGKCVEVGGSKRCSRSCSTAEPCPTLAGWTCNAAQVCGCVAQGKKPDTCNADGDCDGVPDKTPETETCNGRDDDCNGEVDDVPAETKGAKRYFRDADGDTFGDVFKPKWLCQPQTGWVEDMTDCDDSKKETSPVASELCGDKLDNNCNGQLDDRDLCGLAPIDVPDVEDARHNSATLKTCSPSTTVDPSVDVTEIVAKQDLQAVKFTVRLAGAPAYESCASYKLSFGGADKTYPLVYIYRLGAAPCGTQGLPLLEAYYQGKPMKTTAKTMPLRAAPGHVSFTIPKVELYPLVPQASYWLRACTNAKADAALDPTACAADTCETPVAR